MFLEVTSMTFRVRVKAGTSLSQLRLFQGNPTHSKMRGTDLYGAVLLGGSPTPPDGCLRVDVNPIRVNGKPVAAFRANPENPSPVNLWVDKDKNGKPINRPDPTTYWDFDESENGRFRVKQPNFYILRSKERIVLGRGVCVYCRAIDETIGEMRIHYAGFVHPYFGYPAETGQERGTPLIFEVRGHDVNVLLSDNEPLARLQFYRMSQDCPANPDLKKLSPYNNQALRLSQFFEDFPIT
jgi:dCTP deaminase